jgi:hypothetical protein
MLDYDHADLATSAGGSAGAEEVYRRRFSTLDLSDFLI